MISALLPLVFVTGVIVALAVAAAVPIRYNVRNLLVRWRTAVMTGLAFTVVIALLTVMLAFVNGMYALTASSGHDENVIVLSEGSTDEAFSHLGFSDVGDLENQPGVARGEKGPLCSRETYLVINQPVPNPRPGEPKRRFLQLRGVDDPETSGRVHQIEIHAGGGWFSEAGVRRLASEPESAPAAIEVVLGEGIARELGRDRSPEEAARGRSSARLDVGDTLSIGDRRWVIVGVMKSSGATFDSEVWAKRSIIAPLFGKNSYTSLVMRSDDADSAARLANFYNHDYGKAAVRAQVETDYFAALSKTNESFLTAIKFVVAIMAGGGIFGVMNTMFAAVAQRAKDIGVLRLLGFSRWQISLSFLIESLAIAVAGGLAGCLLGSLADGWTASSIVSSGQGGGKFVVLKLVVDSQVIMSGIFTSLAMGLLGGLLPALSAMRLRPLEALR